VRAWHVPSRVRKHPASPARRGMCHGRERDRPLPRAARKAQRGAADSNDTGKSCCTQGSKGPQISEAQGGIVPIGKSERAFKGRFCSLGAAHRELASARRPPRRWKIGPNSAVTCIPLRPTRSGSPTLQTLHAIVTPYLEQCYEERVLFRRFAWRGEALSFDRTAPLVSLSNMGRPRAARRGWPG